MPIDHIIGLLIEERDKLNRAIEALQGTKRRGRPRKNPVAGSVPTAAPAKRKRRKFTVAQREAAAERMRQRWAAKRKAGAKGKPRKTAKAT
jgi:hypothetical protein